jgi:tRNA 2-thiouridine synthesizing protein A
MADTTLDLSGLQCPMPILKTKKAVAALPNGATIEVLSTDPGAPGDFQTWCEQSRNALLESTETGGVYRFVIQRTAS